MQRRRFVLAATTALAAPAVVRAQETLKSAKAAYRLVTLSRDLVQPWGMAFLPDGRDADHRATRPAAAFRQRPAGAAGTRRHVSRSGRAVQAGLLDVCLHPNFVQNRVLYLSYITRATAAARRPRWPAPNWAMAASATSR